MLTLTTAAVFDALIPYATLWPSDSIPRTTPARCALSSKVSETCDAFQYRYVWADCIARNRRATEAAVLPYPGSNQSSLCAGGRSALYAKYPQLAAQRTRTRTVARKSFMVLPRFLRPEISETIATRADPMTDATAVRRETKARPLTEKCFVT